MVVDRHGERPFRVLLPDHVLIEGVLDLPGRGHLGDRFRDFPLLVLSQDLIAERDALVADVDRRARNELPDGVLGLAAEGAAEMLVVGHVGPERWAIDDGG